MKFAPVLSQKYDPGSLSNYHLILAHEVINDLPYAEYYSRLDKEHTIILDSGTVEIGYADSEIILGALKLLDREVIVVAPDFLGDSIKTLEASSDFLKNCNLPPTQLMVVPQGEPWQEWIECFEMFEEIGGYKYVGLPRLAEDFHGGRSWIHQRARQIRHNSHGISDRLTFHLLGIQHTIDEIEWARHFPKGIMGVDSSAPLKAASSSIECKEVKDFRGIKDEVGFKEELMVEVRYRIEELVDYFSFKGVPEHAA